MTRIVKELIQATKCAYYRRQLKHAIQKEGGRVSGNVKLTVGNNACFSFGKALYLNGKGITAANKMQIIVSENGVLSLGDNTGISTSSIFCKKEIIIGNNVNIGAECVIIDSDFHSTNWLDRADRSRDINNAKTASIHIGDYVFIGTRSIVLKGVTIGEKSIIMAGSVVSKDIPACCIAGGNPCRVLKQL